MRPASSSRRAEKPIAPPTSVRHHPETMIRPWKVFRIVLWAILAWFGLALLWVCLPSPSYNDNPTAVLHSGRTLTRVYKNSRQAIYVPNIHRDGFALSYTLNTTHLTIDSSTSLPLSVPENESQWKEIALDVRVGDIDGANLPWFQFADAVLLYWQTQGEAEYTRLQLSVRYNDDMLDVQAPSEESIIRIDNNGTVVVPESSLSPSITYPVRAAVIRVLAPSTIFLSGHLGTLSEGLWSTLGVIFVIMIYVFCIGGVLISVMRLLGGPSLENVVQRMQDKLEVWNQSERLSWLRLGAVQEGVDRVYHNQTFQTVVSICRDGWHPERDRAIATAAAAQAAEEDIEKGNPSK